LFLLLRHAETASNERGVWHSSKDESISPAARKATEAGSKRLDQIIDASQAEIITSDFRRALDTAEIIRAGLGMGPLVLEPLLRERDMGSWAGKSPLEVDRSSPGILAAWEAGSLLGPPGGETDQEVATRGLYSLRRYAARKGSVTLAITHAGVLRSINGLLTGRRSPVPHLGGYYLSLGSDGRFSMGHKIVLGDPDVVPRT
jgi:broad specificity phosphatase PhoE